MLNDILSCFVFWDSKTSHRLTCLYCTRHRPTCQCEVDTSARDQGIFPFSTPEFSFSKFRKHESTGILGGVYDRFMHAFCVELHGSQQKELDFTTKEMENGKKMERLEQTSA